MRVYHILSRIFPSSFLTKVAVLVGVAMSLPMLAATGLFLQLDRPDRAALIAAVTLIFFALTVLGLRAALAPMHLILTAADSWIARKAIDPLPDAYDDEFGRIMRRINQMSAEAQRQLASQRQQADSDPLTGLLNQQGFARMMRGTEAGALLLLDLDHFKAVNECYGHLVGDRVLCHVADTAQESLRKKDLFARWGGGEFVIFLPGAPSTLADTFANRLREAIAIDKAEVGPEVTISIGVATHDGGEGFDQAFAAAKTALHCAKSEGRNRVRHHEKPRAA